MSLAHCSHRFGDRGAFDFVLCDAVRPFSPLQGEGGEVMSSPLITAVAVPIALSFLILGIVYGVGIKSITSPNDVPEFMAKGLKTLVPMMVLFFAVSQFLAWFKASNLGS